MRLKIFFGILATVLIHGCACPGFAQTFVKGPALIETPTITSTAGGTTTLTKDSQTVQIFTGASAQIVKLPDATTIPKGRYFDVYNQSSVSITIEDNGASLIQTVKPNSKVKVVLVDNVSSDGSWASAISYGTIDAGMVVTTPFDDLVSTNTQSMLSELNTKFEGIIANLGASDISYNNTGTGLLATDVQAAINELKTLEDSLKLRFERTLSSGVLSGLDLAVNVDTTKFNIAAGTYEIVDLSNLNSPVYTYVNYPGSTANVVTNLATQDVTYILMDSVGGIIQQATYPTPNQRRQYAFVGRINHSNRTSIGFTNTFPDYKVNFLASFYDLLDAIAPFKMDDGLLVTANGANLSFDRSAGKVFFRSENYVTDKNNPHTKSYNSQTLQPFRKMTRTITADAADVTVLDPTNYDNGGTVTAIGGGTSRSTIQRVYLYKSGAVRVAYGQTIYSTFPDATAAVGKESFVLNPTVEQSAVLIALVVLRRNCTSLQDATCALIVPASRFGGTGGGGGGGGGGASDLQGAYVTSTQPQITLNSTQSGLQIRDASSPIGSTLFAVQNNAGSTSYLGVDVNGISASNFVGTGTTGAVRVHNLTTTQKNALTPAAGMIVWDTTLSQLQVYDGSSWRQVIIDPQNSNLTLAGSGTLAISLTHTQQTWLVQGASAAITMSTTPFGSSVPVSGAEIVVIGNDDTNTVTFPTNDAAKGIIGYSVTLGKGQVATFKYNATLDRYVIKSVSN